MAKIHAFLLLAFLMGAPQSAAAQERTVGGHTAFFLPLVTTGGGNTTDILDRFAIGFPTGISVKGTGRMFFDFEFVPLISTTPHAVDVVVHPGLIWNVSHGFAMGARLAFHTSSPQYGFTPIVIKSLPIEHSFFRSYFLEFDFPVRFVRPEGGPSKNAFNFGVHFGVGF